MVINAFAVLRHGIYSVFRNIYPAFMISWPWIIILGLIYAAAAYLVIASGFGTDPADESKGVGTFFIVLILGLLAYAVGFASIAVNWHRYILLDEMPQGIQRLRIDAHVWSYIWRLIKVSLMSSLVMFIPAMIIGFIAAFVLGAAFSNSGEVETMFNAAAAPSLAARLLLSAALVIISGFAGAVVFRYSLALPAAALGNYEVGIFESWRRTQYNYFQLVLLAGGSAFLQVAAQFVLDGLAYPVASTELFSVGFSILIAIDVVVTWFFTFLGITLLTSLYGHLVEQRPL